MRRIHYISGIILALFIGLHLVNHILSLAGPQAHIDFMTALRVVYRNVFVETVLLLVVLLQIVSGIRLYLQKRKTAFTFFEKVHLWSGLYMAVFFVFHVTAVLMGRYFLNLDTNIYFGVAGLNIFPFNLYFVPYYGLAILSFWGHIAAVHVQRMQHSLWGLGPLAQGKVIVAFGILWLMFTFGGLTNFFQGLEIPAIYHLLLGK